MSLVPVSQGEVRVLIYKGNSRDFESLWNHFPSVSQKAEVIFVEKQLKGQIIAVGNQKQLVANHFKSMVESIQQVFGKIDLFVHCFHLAEKPNVSKHISDMHKTFQRLIKVTLPRRVVQLWIFAEENNEKLLDTLHHQISVLKSSHPHKMEMSLIPLHHRELLNKSNIYDHNQTIQAILSTANDNFSHPDFLRMRKEVSNLALGFANSQLLTYGLIFQLFTYLDKKKLTADELCNQLQLNTHVTEDVLNLLVSQKLLKKIDDKFENSEISKSLLVKHVPGYMGDYLIMISRIIGQSYQQLGSVLSNSPGKTGEERMIEVLSEMDEVKAMRGLSFAWADKLAKLKPFWSRYQSFMDIGSSDGLVASRIGLENPHLHCHLFDLPYVEKQSQQLMQSYPTMQGRYTIHTGNIFTVEKLPSVEVILLGHFIYNFSLEEAEIIIKKAGGSLKKGGAMIIVEPFKGHFQGDVISLSAKIPAKNNGEETDAYPMANIQEAKRDQTKTLEGLLKWLDSTNIFFNFETIKLTEENFCVICHKQ